MQITMRIARRWAALVLLSLVLANPVFSQSTARETPVAKCSALLANLLADPVKVKIGSRTITLSPTPGDEVVYLQRDMRTVKVAGVVVYAPVEIKGRMAMLRFETQGPQRPLLEELVAESTLTETDFQKMLVGAQRPSAQGYREELSSKLLPNPARDRGKIVFFKDTNFYGLLPKAFGVDDGITAGSSSIQRAVNNRATLANLKLDPKGFTAFMGYPETAEDLATIFAGHDAASLEVWREQADAFRTIATDHQFELFAANDLRKLGTKETILRRMEAAKGIVFIVAHANGCHILLPGGETVDITPNDIAGLKFGRSPFVVLRICNGVDNGFATAFMRAGASGVWANRGVIDAETANSQVSRFMELLGAGIPALDAARRVENIDPHAKTAVGLFTSIFNLRRGSYTIY